MTSHTARRSTRDIWLEVVLLVVAPLAFTAARLANGYVFDDVFVIAEGTFIHDISNLPRAFTSHTMVASTNEWAVGDVPMDTYRPLTLVTFFWDAAISGRAPWSYHVTNALAHTATGVLVMRLVERLVGRATALPLLLAAWFALAPWLAEAHVWINGRSDVFAGFFLVSAALLHHNSLHASTPGAWVGTALCALSALLCKETAAPAVLLLAALPAPVSLANRARLAAPLVVGVIVYAAMRGLALDGMRTHADTTHLLTALHNLPLLWWDSIWHVVLPQPFVLRNLRDDYATISSFTHNLSVAASLLLAMAMAIAWRRGATVVTWGLCLTLATAAPAAMISTALWPGFGRYLYLPAIGLVLAAAPGVRWIESRADRMRKPLLGALALLSLSSGLWLFDATLNFRDDVRLYERSLAAAPDQGWTSGFLGLALKRNGICDAAIEHLQRADHLAPDEPRYTIHLAQCLVATGHVEAAKAVTRRGRSRFANTRAEAGFLMTELGTVRRGNTDEAEALVNRCLQLVPDRSDCLAAREALAQERAQKHPEPNRRSPAAVTLERREF